MSEKNCCVIQLQCCCMGRPCTTCCIPPIKESISSRIMYVLFFFLGAVLSCVFYSETIEDQLINLPRLLHLCDLINAGEECSRFLGYVSVYRICYATAAFFCLMMILTFWVKKSKTLRGGLHNGYWLIKFLVLIGFWIGSLYIPLNSKGHMILLYVGLSGAFAFIFVQLFLLVDFAASMHKRWIKKIDNGGSKCWYIVLIFFIILFYTIALGFTFICIEFHSTPFKDCFRNIIFPTLSLVLIAVITIMAIIPIRHTENTKARTSLLQSGMVSAYIMYITWSALLVQPPLTVSINMHNASETSLELFTNDSNSDFFLNETMVVCKPTGFLPAVDKVGSGTGDFLNSAVSLIIILVVAIYSCLITSSRIFLGELETNKPIHIHIDRSSMWSCCLKKVPPTREAREAWARGWGAIRNELEGVTYSYSFFHATFMLAMMYIMMELTNWYSPEQATLETLNRTWPPFWVKLISAWCGAAMFAIKLFYTQFCNCCRRKEQAGSSRKHTHSDQNKSAPKRRSETSV